MELANADVVGKSKDERRDAVLDLHVICRRDVASVGCALEDGRLCKCMIAECSERYKT